MSNMFTKPILDFAYTIPKMTATKRVLDHFYRDGVMSNEDRYNLMDEAIDAAIQQCKAECNELQKIRENIAKAKNKEVEIQDLLSSYDPMCGIRSKIREIDEPRDKPNDDIMARLHCDWRAISPTSFAGVTVLEPDAIDYSVLERLMKRINEK